MICSPAFKTVGALREPNWARSPIDVGKLSTPPVARPWQELQLIVSLFERRGSKNSIFPKRTLTAVVGLSGGAGIAWGSGANTALASWIRSAPRDGAHGQDPKRKSVERAMQDSEGPHRRRWLRRPAVTVS